MFKWEMDEVSGTKYNENLNAKDLYNKFEKILRPNIRKNIIKYKY